MSSRRLTAAMADLEAVAALPAVVAALSGLGIPASEISERVPKQPGLYAIHGDQAGIDQLELQHFVGPLYVGKAERSLNSRDARIHFATAQTGWSTVRRSMAALLESRLELVVALRNNTIPARPANYGLEVASEVRLTNWMCRHLCLTYWLKPEGLVLDNVETLVIDRLQPPLNLDKVRHRHLLLDAARQRMRLEAKGLVGNASS